MAGMRETKAASSLLLSKSLPGTMPISANLATASASAAVGGLVFIRSQSNVKYSTASMRLTCSRTAVFMSMVGSILPAGGVQSLP
ncbi:hypothetical protein D9M70_536000 [compost metagenome]